MTAFEDLGDEEDDPGDEALDELGETLTENTDSVEQESDDESGYDPQSEPAYPYAKAKTQHSIYCLPETWEEIDGNEGLLFEAEIQLRREGCEDIHKRELHEALLRCAAKAVAPNDVAGELKQLREERTEGTLL